MALSETLDRPETNGRQEAGDAEAGEERGRGGMDQELLTIGRVQRLLDGVGDVKARGRILAYLVARNLPFFVRIEMRDE